jgi:L-threonylcarbamoyladenylate synthase
LRPGGISVEAIEAVLGRPLDGVSDVRAPGGLRSHYAPRARVLAVDARELEAVVRAQIGRVVVLGDRDVSGVARIDLPSDPNRAAPMLYGALREVDEQGFDVAVVALPAPVGLGRAIADRLRRASAG